MFSVTDSIRAAAISALSGNEKGPRATLLAVVDKVGNANARGFLRQAIARLEEEFPTLAAEACLEALKVLEPNTAPSYRFVVGPRTVVHAFYHRGEYIAVGGGVYVTAPDIVTVQYKARQEALA